MIDNSIKAGNITLKKENNPASLVTGAGFRKGFYCVVMKSVKHSVNTALCALNRQVIQM